MSVRQYVGARYVPRFSPINGGVWDNSYNYEALEIVKYGNDYYTSKKPVPTGVAITNTEYWVLTGNYNGAIGNLQSQIGDLNNLDESADNLVEAINNNTGDIQEIINSSIKRLLFFGDSYCDSNRGGYTKGVYTRFLNKTGLVDNTNIKLYALGGAGFVGAGQGKTFGNLLNDAITEAHFAPSDVTDIIIAGGDNDQSYSIQEINSAKDNFTTLAHNTYPNAKIWIACIGGFVDAVSRYSLISRVNYVYCYEPKSYVFPIINAMSAMQFMHCFDSDGIHPNNAGVGYIGDLLASAFKANSNYGQFGTNTINNTTLNTISGEVTTAPTFEVDIKQQVITIQFKKGSNFAPTNSISFAYNTGAMFKLGSVDNTKVFPCPNVAASNTDSFRNIPCEMWAMTSSVTWIRLSGELVIVKTGATTADVYFRTTTAEQNGQTTNFRCGYVKAILTN